MKNKLLFLVVMILITTVSESLLIAQDSIRKSISLHLDNQQSDAVWTNINPPTFNIWMENLTDDFVLFESTNYFSIDLNRLLAEITSPKGKVHLAVPNLAIKQGQPEVQNYSILNAKSQTRKLAINFIRMFQENYWDWWQQALLIPGEYQITLLYLPPVYGPEMNPALIKDTLRSDTITFNVEETVHYLPEPEHTRIVNAGKSPGKYSYNYFLHLRYINAGGKVTGERFFVQQNEYERELAFEIIYDHPIKADAFSWYTDFLRIDAGSSTEYILLWKPDSTVQQKINGKVRTWDLDNISQREGQPLATFNYRDGLPEGSFQAIVGGSTINGAFISGLQEGEWVVTRQSKLLYHGHFKQGEKEGKFERYHHFEDQLIESGMIINGKKDGTFLTFNEHGQLLTHKEYTHGVAVGIWRWYNQQGELIAKGSYKDGQMYDGTFFLDRPASHSNQGPKQPVEYEHGKYIEHKEPNNPFRKK